MGKRRAPAVILAPQTSPMWIEIAISLRFLRHFKTRDSHRASCESQLMTTYSLYLIEIFGQDDFVGSERKLVTSQIDGRVITSHCRFYYQSLPISNSINGYLPNVPAASLLRKVCRE